MKRRLLCLCLAAALLSVTAYAAQPGSGEDPLVSLSYLTRIFIPGFWEKAEPALSAAAEKAAAEREEQGAYRVSLPPGSTAALDSGQTLLLLSGEAVLGLDSGCAVNLAQGAEWSGGQVPALQRCLVCEDSAGFVCALTDAELLISGGAELLPAGSRTPFRDVERMDWYFEDVAMAWTRGLVDGVSADRFAPEGYLTVAQCVKLCACMHQLYHTGQVTLESGDEEPWYWNYVAYARFNDIITGEEDLGAEALRDEFVGMFYRALPQEAYRQINIVPEGSIPDLPSDARWAEEIYAFYRAGILTGYPEDGRFWPPSGGKITRAEAAAIMSRMFDEGQRISFAG